MVSRRGADVDFLSSREERDSIEHQIAGVDIEQRPKQTYPP